MDVCEHQGKAALAAAGITVPKSGVARDLEEAQAVAERLGYPLVAKAQVLTGGRGKAGGVRAVGSSLELAPVMRELLGLRIKDLAVDLVLLERAVDIAQEFYLSVVLDRAAKQPVLLFSHCGGVDIEALARDEPDVLLREAIDSLVGLREFQVRRVCAQSGLAAEHRTELADILRRLWRLYQEHDATLVEVNPLALRRPPTAGTVVGVETGSPAGRLIALDAKLSIDDNARFRQSHEPAPGGADDLKEQRARQAGLAYVSLDGDIGVLGNGAGLVMSLLDQIAASGGRAANFLDVGGGAGEERIATALDIILQDPRVKVLLISIFGGITRCDEVARGLLAALERTGAELPVVVALAGTNAEQGRSILERTRRGQLVAAADAATAVRAAVAMTVGGQRDGAAMSTDTARAADRVGG